MGRLEEAKGILMAIGMPKQQTNDRSAYVLLALAHIKESDAWALAARPKLRIVDMMHFMAENYRKIYKPNTRETIRKDTIHQFVEGAVAERNTDSADRPTNSPNYCYCLTAEMQELVRSYGTNRWQNMLSEFIREKGSLTVRYRQERNLARVPVTINGQELSFGAGKHNRLQKAIIEEFGARFAQEAEVLYVGDAENKDLIKNREKLSQLGVQMTDHDKLPDVVLYKKDKGWIYFIEAVTSVEPMSVKRMNEIQAMSRNCQCGKIYITAFLDSGTYKKFVDELAWDTEVWIADMPDHMVHLNGDRFLGPR